MSAARNTAGGVRGTIRFYEGMLRTRAAALCRNKHRNIESRISTLRTSNNRDERRKEVCECTEKQCTAGCMISGAGEDEKAEGIIRDMQ